MAIAPGIVQFVNTNCVEKALAEQWDEELTDKLNGLVTSKCGFIISILSLGLLGPLFFRERSTKKSNQKQIQVNDSSFSLHHISLPFLLQNHENNHIKNKGTERYVFTFLLRLIRKKTLCLSVISSKLLSTDLKILFYASI